MAQHTPGPWHAGEGNGEGSIFMTREGRMRMEQGGTTLYPICTMVRGWEAGEDLANAALVAASPDLLSALSALLWQIERDDGIEWADDSPAMGMVRDARAAIAKARGQ